MMRLLKNFFTISTLPKKDKFLALVKPPIGLIKEITPQEKLKINQEITKKLQQLEDTGLSKQQILLSKSQKGLPLKIDSFFQFIKNNLKAREIYLKAGDRFTVENVVDIALRQDIGADPSNSRIRAPDIVDTKGRADLLYQLKDLRQGKFNPNSYDGPSKFTVQRAYDELKPHQPLRHYFKPLDRYEKRQQNLRQIKKYDIHWRNVQLLRQFLTVNGNIKSRYRSFLSNRDQRAVRVAIKTARIMAAMPYFGRAPQPLKRNITSLEDEVQQIGYQHLNLQTGHLFQTRSRSMDSLQVQIENENDLDYKYKKMTNNKSYKIWINSLEKQSTQEEIQSQKYARWLKNKQYQEESKSKKVLNQNVNNVLQGISKYKALRGQSVNKIPPSNEQVCRNQYEREKEQLKEKISIDPNSVLSKLLNDKLKA